MFKCPTCSAEYETLNSLRVHCQRAHKMSSKDMYVAVVLEGKSPVCRCGCGKEPRFADIGRGFSTYVRGHQSRVKNNWGHNPTALSKSHQYRRDLIAKGEWEPWAKGHTKETHPSLASSSVKNIKAATREGEHEKRSKRMRENRLSGVVPTQTGANHSQWKGGTSALQEISRSRLFKVWNYPKLVESGFKCTKCDATKGLEVHHDQERFASILYKAIDKFGEVHATTEFEKKSEMADWIVDYHVVNSVSGVVLCERCHEEEHAVSDASRSCPAAP